MVLSVDVYSLPHVARHEPGPIVFGVVSQFAHCSATPLMSDMHVESKAEEHVPSSSCLHRYQWSDLVLRTPNVPSQLGIVV